MTFKQSKIKTYMSPLIYFLIVFILLDNYLIEVFGFKTKLDELLLLIINIISLYYLVSKIVIKNKLSFLEFFLSLLLLTLIISSIVNYNTGIIQKMLGSYFLIKSLNIFYFVYKFGITKKYLYKILKLIIYVAVFGVIIQILQYLIPNINSLSAGLIPSPYITNDFIRCSGILGAPNRTAQLIVIAYICHRLYGNSIFHYRTIIFLIGILLASSNLNLFSFFLVVALDLVKDNKKMILPFIISISGVIFAFGGSILFRINQLYELAYINESYFRLFAFLNSINVLNDNIFFGVGPGMYGGSVASILGTPIHNQYHTFSYYVNSQHMPTTIDMFFPHLWAEIGLVGLTFFLFIFLLIFKKNISYNKNNFYLLNILLGVLLLSGVSTFSIENTFSSVIIYTIIASFMYWENKNVKLKKK